MSNWKWSLSINDSANTWWQGWAAAGGYWMMAIAPQESQLARFLSIQLTQYNKKTNNGIKKFQRHFIGKRKKCLESSNYFFFLRVILVLQHTTPHVREHFWMLFSLIYLPAYLSIFLSSYVVLVLLLSPSSSSLFIMIYCVYFVLYLYTIGMIINLWNRFITSASVSCHADGNLLAAADEKSRLFFFSPPNSLPFRVSFPWSKRN